MANENQTLEKLRKDIQDAGLHATAKRLGISRHTVASAALGAARRGSVELIAAAYRDLEQQ